MMGAALIRYKKAPDHTRGLMGIGGELFHIIEPPWVDNKRNVSCISSGLYEVNYMARSSSGKYRDVYHLQDVYGRHGILMHKGNTVEHTLGCLIIGMKAGELAGKPAVLQSATALQKLHEVTGRKTFMMRIY